MDSGIIFSEETDNDFVIGVPFVKVDAEKRTVEGFATLDNVDKASDIVDFEASKEAFAEWPGNIREMHTKDAVGKALEISEKTFVGPDGATYQGIWVKARISKGAENTWQKVLDGTLSGFSIGGATLEKTKDIVKDAADNIRECWRITKYKLGELSLVDNPCNQFATISLVKSIDGTLVVEDSVDEGALEKSPHIEGESDCCAMEINGALEALNAWRQKGIDSNNDYLVSSVSEIMARIRSYMTDEDWDHKYAATEKSANNNKEVTVMETLQDNENNDISKGTEFTSEDTGLLRKFIDFIKGETSETDAPVEDEDPADEGEAEEEVQKENSDNMNEELVKETITGAVEEVNKSVDEKFSAVGESLTTITELLAKLATTEAVEASTSALTTTVEGLASRIEAIENSGAVKKSADDAGSAESLEKSEEPGLWSGNLVPEFLQKQMQL